MLKKRKVVRNWSGMVTHDTDGLQTLDVDAIHTEHADLKAKQEEISAVQATLREEVTKLQNHAIGKAEFTDRMTKIADDLTTIEHDLQVMRQAAAVKESRFIYNDFRSVLEGFDWLRHDDGRKFTDIEYRAYALFQLPISYDKFDHGQELKNLRDLHDAFILVDAYNTFKHSKGHRYTPTQHALFKQLTNQVKKFDETLYHAMAGGNTGYGAEWIPTGFSSEFNDILRIQPALANKFQVWNMPPGASGYFPFQEGKASVYKGGESLVDNAEQARKTNIATDRKLFSPVPFIGALKTSEEITEDSLFEMVGFVRRELATAVLEGLDSAIINADTTSPHMDNAAETYWNSYDVETSFKGLRRIAVDDSNTFDVEGPASGTGVGALEMVCFLYAKGLMGVIGVRNSECLFVTGVKGKKEIQTMWVNEDQIGVLALMISGQVPDIDGTPVYISGEYLEDQESDGFGDNVGAEKHTSILCVHTPSFRVATRRDVTLEMDKDILTQQQVFVATARYDFGKVCSSSLDPVVCGINVQHTA